MTRNIVRQIHLWLGIALCIPLLLLGLTGSVLVFEDELRAAFGPAPHVAGSGPAHSADEIIAAARTAAPSGYVPQSYMAPAEPGALAVVRLTLGQRGPGPSEQLRVEVDPATLQAFPDQGADLLRQIFFLHSTLLMKNREGRRLIGWLGVVMLVMGVSGLVNWWPRGDQWRAPSRYAPRTGFPAVPRSCTARQGFGVWRFLSSSVSPASIGFSRNPSEASSIRILPARDLRAAAALRRVEPVKGPQPLAIDDAIDLPRAARPERGCRLGLPARAAPISRFASASCPRVRKEGRRLITVFVDPWARRVIERARPASSSDRRARPCSLGSMRLHAGQALGWVWKLLVFLCGLLPLLFVVTGVAMWWLKRRAAGAALPTRISFSIKCDTARRAGE